MLAIRIVCRVLRDRLSALACEFELDLFESRLAALGHRSRLVEHQNLAEKMAVLDQPAALRLRSGGALGHRPHAGAHRVACRDCQR